MGSWVGTSALCFCCVTGADRALFQEHVVSRLRRSDLFLPERVPTSKVEHGVTHGPSGNTIVAERLIRTRSGEPMCSPNTHGRNEDEEITCAWGPESVKQDKRPRHTCAPKRLSAHPFFRHAPGMAPCRCAYNLIKLLHI